MTPRDPPKQPSTCFDETGLAASSTSTCRSREVTGFSAPTGSHLDRWRGNALAQVGDAEAIKQLTGALAELPASWVRARAGLLVDLAYAYAAAGNRDAAISHAREARAIARQINSDRQL